MSLDGPSEERVRQKRQRARSLAIALALGLMAIIFYVATIVRLGPNALSKDSFGTPTGTPTSSGATSDQEACKKAGTC